MYHKFPTPEDILSSTIALSDNLTSLKIQHAIIGSSALYLHALAHRIPYHPPNHISVLLPAPRQAATETSVIQLYNILCTKYAKSYKIRKYWGPGVREDILQILAPNGEEENVGKRKEEIGRAWIDIKVVDYWTFPELKSTFDMTGYNDSIIRLPVEIFEPDEISDEEEDDKYDIYQNEDNAKDKEVQPESNENPQEEGSNDADGNQDKDDGKDEEAEPARGSEEQLPKNKPAVIKHTRREDQGNEEEFGLMSFLTIYSLFNWMDDKVLPKESRSKPKPKLDRPFLSPKIISPSRVFPPSNSSSTISKLPPPCGYVKVLPASSLLLILIRTFPFDKNPQELKTPFFDIYTLLTVLDLYSQKLRIRGRKDKAALRGLIEVWEDGMEVLKLVIVCPDVLGWQARFEGKKTILLALVCVGVVWWATRSRADFE